MDAWKPRLAGALGGAAGGGALVVLAVPQAVVPWPALGLAAGLLMGHVPATARRWLVGASALVALAAAASPGAGPLLALCGAAALTGVLTLAWRADGPSAPAEAGVAVAAVAGATIPLAWAADWPSGSLGLLLVSLMAIACCRWAREAAATQAPPRAGSTPAALAVALRLGCTIPVAGSLLALAGPEAFAAPWGFARAMATQLAGVGIGLAAVSLWPALKHPRAWLVCEPLAWLLALGLAADGPGYLLADGEAVRIFLLVGGALAGAGLASHLPGRAAGVLLVASLAWPLGAGLLEASSQSWAPGDRLALALGQDPPPDAFGRAQLDESGATVRFATWTAPALAIVDVPRGQEQVRVLSLGGQVAGLVPLGPQLERLTLGSRLAAALPSLILLTAPKQVAVLGVTDGLLAAAVLSSPDLERLRLVEGAPGLLAAHRDPRQLLGPAAAAVWSDGRVEVLEQTPQAFLQTAPRTDAILLRQRPTPARCKQVARAATCSVWLLGALTRAELAALLASHESVLAFGPLDDQLVVIASAEPLELSPARLRERWALGSEQVRALQRCGLAAPLELLVWLTGEGEALRSLTQGDPHEVIPTDELLRLSDQSLRQQLAALPPEDSLELADALARRGHPAALEVAEAAARLAPSAASLLRVSALLLRQGQEGRAYELLQEALELEPEARAPREALARFHLDRARPLDAFELLADVDTSEPAPPSWHALRGRLALTLDAPASAAAHFEAAGDFQDSAAQARFCRGRPDQAPKVRLRLSEALLGRVERDGTPEDVRQALTLLLPLADDAAAGRRDLSAEVLTQLAKHLERAARHDPARAEYLQRTRAGLLARMPVDAATIRKRARALAKGGEHAAAEALVADACAGPARDDAPLHRLLGDLRLEQERWEPAAIAYERGLELGGTSSDALVYPKLARAYRALGRLDDATACLTRGVEQFPGGLRLRLSLAELLIETGDAARAKTELERVLREAAGSPLADDAQRLLDALERGE